MIRINLLKPEPGARFSRGVGSPWISRREVWAGVSLLVIGSGLLFFLASHGTRPAGQSQAPPPSAAPPPSPAPQPSPPASPSPAPPEKKAEPLAREAPSGQVLLASDLSIRQTADGLILGVQLGAGTLEPRSMKLDSPSRLVIDIPNCRLMVPTEQYSRPVEHPVVKRVRASQFQIDPPICRIVLDMTSFPRYEIIPRPSGLEIRVLDRTP